MTVTKDKPARRTKRKLSDINFSGEDSHIALVSKKQGGPANGADYKLVLKSNKFSEEFIEKVQQVRVTMDLPDFLERFFNLYGEQADILAYMMGYVEPAETQAMEQAEAEEDYQDWIKSKMEAFEILKSAHEAESLADVLSTLEETEYLSMLNDQVTIEKALEELQKAYKPKVGDMVSWNSSGGRATGKVTKITTQGTVSVPDTEFTLTATEENPAALIRIYRDGKPTDTIVGHKAGTLTKVSKALAKESEPAANAEGNDTSPACEVTTQEVSASVNKQELEKTNMEVETVEKAQFELVQKALDEQKVQLQKALDTIAQFEAEKKEAINKAKTEQIKAIVKDESKVEAIAKAALSLESEDDFNAFVTAMQAVMQAVETSEMFVEKGASTQEEPAVKESAVAKLLKAKQQTK